VHAFDYYELYAADGHYDADGEGEGGEEDIMKRRGDVKWRSVPVQESAWEGEGKMVVLDR